MVSIIKNNKILMLDADFAKSYQLILINKLYI